MLNGHLTLFFSAYNLVKIRLPMYETKRAAPSVSMPSTSEPSDFILMLRQVKAMIAPKLIKPMMIQAVIR